MLLLMANAKVTWIEMSSRDRPEDQDQHDQYRPGRDGVAQQSQGDVPARELLRHDPGADHSGEQECSTNELTGDLSAPEWCPRGHASCRCTGTAH